MRNLLPSLLFLLVAGGALPSCFLFHPKPPVYSPVQLESGLVIQDKVVPKKGPKAALGDEVTVHYRMWLQEGGLVDSSYERATPISFVLGDGEVPPAFELGVVGMRLFGRRRILAPPHLGYGAEGMPPTIPPFATLHIHLELLELTPFDARRLP